jgi:uncharacterized repeat protein (TIGR01451 family)
MTHSNSIWFCLLAAALFVFSLAKVRAETPQELASFDHVAPVLSVKILSPPEINLGRVADYTLSVTNLGRSSAEVVVVQVALPTGAPLLNASPEPGSVKEGIARFNLGKIASREERKIHLQFKPEKLGPLQLQARTSFAIQSDAEIQVCQPKLAIRCSAPLQVGYGDCVEYEVTISNSGDGTARNVVITPDLPSKTHIDDSSTAPISFEQLAPGESQVVCFCANAVSDGVLDAIFTVRDNMDQEVRVEWQVTITRPLLSVAMEGPSIRYLHRNGEYIVRVSNPGNAATYHVDVVMAIPFGLKILGTSKEAICNKSKNTLSWQLPQLDPGAEISWSVYTRASDEGRHVPQTTATTKDGLSAADQVATEVVLRPQLYATVINQSGPVEVGEIASFSVLVTNHGTRHANHVVISVALPEGMEAETADGVKIAGRQIHFEPINLSIGQKRELQFRAIGHKQGEHIVRVTYGNDASQTELAVEGEAFFYSDNSTTYVAEKPDFRPDAPSRLLK